MGWLRPSYKHLVCVFTIFVFVYFWINHHFSHPRNLIGSNGGDVFQIAGVKSDSRRSEASKGQGCKMRLPFIDVLQPDVLCQLTPVDESICPLMDKLFFSKPTDVCSGTEQQFCRLAAKESDNGEAKLICDLSACAEHHMGYFNTKLGRNVWLKSSHSNLASVNMVINGGLHQGYLYIRCTDDNAQDSGTQLLILPVKPSPALPHQAAERVNLNVLFIDSVSYYHFHRSMPLTLAALEKINAADSAKVLSYPLYQSVKSRTFENIEALLGGSVNLSDTFGILSLPNHKLGIRNTYQLFKDSGYTTMFMEDLCWHWEWGIAKDLRVHNKTLSHQTYWQRLQGAFREAAIDSYGISPSSCEILEETGKPDPFHDLATVCYNGRHHHDYFLEYLLKYQESHIKSGIPFANLYLNDVGHDHTGRRIQTLDDHLSRYVTEATKQTNTLTILLSDHGNARGYFVENTDQGRRERFHALLYLIAPKGVQAIFGDEIMQRLTNNQARLISALDLHQLFLYISGSKEPSGLVSNLPSDRTCADLPLYQPNICLCSGSGGDKELSSLNLKLLAEFSAGYLSNLLIRDVGGSAKANCRILLLNDYSNALVTKHKEGNYIVTMDLHFNGTTPDANKETIMASVRFSPHDHSVIQLISFERTSTFSTYTSCCDNHKYLSLCICENNKLFPLNFGHNLVEYARISGLVANTLRLDLSKCVTLVQYAMKTSTSSIAQGSSVYLVNKCTGSRTFTVRISLKPTHDLFYSSLPADDVVLGPNDVYFVTVIHYNSYKIENVDRFLHFALV